MEMTKDGFWDLIAEAKKRYGQDQDGSFQWLKDQLTILGPQQAQDFHDILHGYQQLANQYGLWSAAILMCEHGCTDDGFIDFRAWLIAQGREVYLAALADPDSLAEVEAYGGCQFEELTDTGNGKSGQTRISAIENSHANLTSELALAYSKNFDVSLEYIFCISDDMRPENKDIKEVLRLSDITISKIRAFSEEKTRMNY